MATSMRVLGFAASNSQNSINKQLVSHALSLAKEELDASIDINILDLNDYEMPIYSIDRENENGIPELAKTFFRALGDADRLIISYAEHNGLYTAAYKNIFDWCSRIDKKVFQDKPMLIMAASPGPGGGANVLKTAQGSAGFFGAEIRGSLSVGKFYETFDSDNARLSNPGLAEQLRGQLKLLLSAD